MNKFRAVVGTLAALAVAAPAASAHTDAEIFATNNTAVITDPADPRLNDRLKDFARQVSRIIDDGGGRAGDSELLDGVFSFDGVTTFERSRASTSTASARTSCTRSRTRSARASASSRC